MKEKRSERIDCLTNQPPEKALIKKYLLKLNKKQRKIFYGIFVHCWAHNQGFISKQNFPQLWRALNDFCHELDESFPNPYDNHEEMVSYCKAHPYYFIDILTPKMIANLFSEYCDEHLDVLASLVQILYEQEPKAAHQYITDMLAIEGHTAEELESSLEEHIATCS